MSTSQEFTPPTDGVGVISADEKQAAVNNNPVSISDEERSRYLQTYVPASQAIRDSTPELVAAINTGTAGVLEQYGQNIRPSKWFIVGKGIGYVFGTVGLWWLFTAVSNRSKGTNSVSK